MANQIKKIRDKQDINAVRTITTPNTLGHWNEPDGSADSNSFVMIDPLSTSVADLVSKNKGSITFNNKQINTDLTYIVLN